MMEPGLPVIIDGSVAHLPSTDFRNATASADGYARAEKSLRTRQAYEGQLRHFAAWCAEAGAPFMPSNADTVAAHLAAVADSGKSTSTVMVRLAAIAYDYVYVPDRLIAGNLKIVTASVTLTGGAPMKRGTVLGQVLLGVAAAAVAAAGNTGNGTIGAQALGAKGKVGTYTVTFTSPTAYSVVNPNGVQLANGKAPGAYTDPEIGFTFTAGATAMAAGDSFTIAVAPGAGGFKTCVATATDGSQNPSAVLVDDVDATAGDLTGGIYQMAELNGNALILDPSLTLAGVAAALRPLGLFVKSAVSAADPIEPTPVI